MGPVQSGPIAMHWALSRSLRRGHDSVSVGFVDDDIWADQVVVTPLTAAPMQSETKLQFFIGAVVQVSVPGLAFVQAIRVLRVCAGTEIVQVPPALLLHLTVSAFIATLMVNDVGPPPAIGVIDHPLDDVRVHVIAAPARAPEQPAQKGVPVMESPGPIVPEMEKVLHDTSMFTPTKEKPNVSPVPAASVNVAVLLPPAVMVAEAGAAMIAAEAIMSTAARPRWLTNFMRCPLDYRQKVQSAHRRQVLTRVALSLPEGAGNVQFRIRD